MKRVQSLGHRGFLSAAPENTLASFRKAIELKPDMIECDVRRTSDGRLIVIHDRRVDRTTNGTGEVAEMTFDELRSLDAGSWFGPEYAGERLPTLDELLDLSRGKTSLVIEIKADGVEEQVLRAVLARDMADEVYLIEQDLMRPVIPFYQAVGDCLVSTSPLVWQLPKPVDADAIRLANEKANLAGAILGIHHTKITPDLVEATHAADMGIMGWPVDVEEDIRAMVGMGVDVLSTNDLANLHQVLRDMGLRADAP